MSGKGSAAIANMICQYEFYNRIQRCPSYADAAEAVGSDERGLAVPLVPDRAVRDPEAATSIRKLFCIYDVGGFFF